MEHTSLSDALISLIPTYGPWIIFGIVALESAGVPLPGETILVAAALLAATCVCRKSDSAILMVKAAKDRSRDDGAEELNRAMERGVLVQRSMSPRHIIIGGISA